MYLKVNDEVVVIAGKDKYTLDKKGNRTKELKKGKIIRVFPKENKVLVQGVNMIKKHVKPSQMNNGVGSIVDIEAPIHASNVLLYDPKAKAPCRIKIVEKEVNGKVKKIRVSKKSGHEFA